MQDDENEKYMGKNKEEKKLILDLSFGYASSPLVSPQVIAGEARSESVSPSIDRLDNRHREKGGGGAGIVPIVGVVLGRNWTSFEKAFFYLPNFLPKVFVKRKKGIAWIFLAISFE